MGLVSVTRLISIPAFGPGLKDFRGFRHAEVFEAGRASMKIKVKAWRARALADIAAAQAEAEKPRRSGVSQGSRVDPSPKGRLPQLSFFLAVRTAFALWASSPAVARFA